MVEYNGPNSGYAPSSSCDSHATNPPQNPNGPWTCLSAFGAAVSGWGVITPFSGDLNVIEQNLVSLAQATDATSKSFRDLHYYTSNANLPFSFYDANQNVIYPGGLVGILYLNAAQVQ
jgi:hypothetical protein